MLPDAVAAIYQRYKLSTVIETIAPDDEMYSSGQPWYFSVGESGLLAVLRAVAISSLTKVESILDLPCGHGRVARHLRAAFPESSMTFCDVLRSCVDFCAETFGGRGIYSTPDLSQVHLSGPFDVIWVGSLFTHVDLPRTVEWIRFLCLHLSEHGILVASFHGHWTVELQRSAPLIEDGAWQHILEGIVRTGYGYADYSPGLNYGISVSKPEKIIEIVSNMPGTRILSYTERGWADNHDVLALERTDQLRRWS